MTSPVEPAGGRGLAAGSVILLLFLLGVVRAGASAASTVGADTVWQGTVELTDDLTVSPGATLLILPGTVVRVAKRWSDAEKRGVLLDVRGRLLAQGRNDRPILFTSASGDPKPGDWAGIVFTKARAAVSRLAHCRIEYADAALQGGVSEVVVEDSSLRGNRVGLAGFEEFRATVVGCDVSGNEKGFYFDGDPHGTVDRCRITGNSKVGVEARHGSSPAIRGCQIVENGPAGILCVSGAHPKVEGNVVRGNERGIDVELLSNPEIVGNEIVDNGTGVWAERQVSPILRGNVIARNAVGVYCNLAARPLLRANDFVDNRRFAVVLGDNQSLAAEKALPRRVSGQQPRGGPLAGKLAPGAADAPQAKDALVDARENWWGEAGTQELKRLGPEGNASLFEDGSDKPMVQFVGPGGERTGRQYPRDKVVFVPWADGPVAKAGRVETVDAGARGSVVHEGRPTEGARVYGFREDEPGRRGEGVGFSPPTGPDGAFFLRLPPGRYRLVARRTSSAFPGADPEPGELVGESTRPVDVGEGQFAESEISLAQKPAR